MAGGLKVLFEDLYRGFLAVVRRFWGYGSVEDQVGRTCVVMRVWAVLVGGCESLVKGGELGSKESRKRAVRGGGQVDQG